MSGVCFEKQAPWTSNHQAEEGIGVAMCLHTTFKRFGLARRRSPRFLLLAASHMRLSYLFSIKYVS